VYNTIFGIGYFSCRDKKCQENLLQAMVHKHEVSSLLECAGAVLKHQNFSDTAREIFDVCKRLIGATSGYVALLDKAGVNNEVLFIDAAGVQRVVNPALPMPIRGLRQTVYTTGQTVYINDFSESEWARGLPQDHIDVENVLFIPLVNEHHVVGHFSLANKSGGFTDYDAKIGEAFGRFASIALQHTLTQEKLMESEQKHRTLVEISPDAIIIEQDGQIVFANTMFVKMINEVGVEEVIGRSVLDFIHPDSIMVLAGQVADEEGRIPPNTHLKCLQADGTVIDVAANRAWFIYNGKPAKIVTVRDISERKRMEEEMLKSSKLEAVNLLAGGIAHDFNNLLTIILGNLSIAKMYSDKNSNLYRKLWEIENAANQTKDLTRQLLTLSKEPVFEKKTVSIGDVLVEFSEFALHGTNCSAEYSIDDGLSAVYLDKARFGQVINNLIINATQAMNDGGLIHIGAKQVELSSDAALICSLIPGQYVKITVEDQGIGIAPEILNHIFDPFFTTKDDGNGLGLSTSYNIIKKHDGHIAVESQPKEGTTFSIYLPVSTEEVNNYKEDVVFPGQGKLLLMDDHIGVRDTAGEMLRFLGFEVDFAESGQQAVTMYSQAMNKKDSYDVVILDKTVRGGMGGLKTISFLQEINPEVKAILSSGYATTTTLEEIKEKGFAAFIGKPYKIEELSSIIKEIYETGNVSQCK
jgi:PAS domain S-box-containing protein